jgi:hypothetical protein
MSNSVSLAAREMGPVVVSGTPLAVTVVQAENPVEVHFAQRIK